MRLLINTTGIESDSSQRQLFYLSTVLHPNPYHRRLESRLGRMRHQQIGAALQQMRPGGWIELKYCKPGDDADVHGLHKCTWIDCSSLPLLHTVFVSDRYVLALGLDFHSRPFKPWPERASSSTPPPVSPRLGRSSIPPFLCPAWMATRPCPNLRRTRCRNTMSSRRPTPRDPSHLILQTSDHEAIPEQRAG
jgi:hypothetical protein